MTNFAHMRGKIVTRLNTPKRQARRTKQPIFQMIARTRAVLSMRGSVKFYHQSDIARFINDSKIDMTGFNPTAQLPAPLGIFDMGRDANNILKPRFGEHEIAGRNGLR